MIYGDGDISIKNCGQEEASEVMSTVSDPVKKVDAVDDCD